LGQTAEGPTNHPNGPTKGTCLPARVPPPQAAEEQQVALEAATVRACAAREAAAAATQAELDRLRTEKLRWDATAGPPPRNEPILNLTQNLDRCSNHPLEAARGAAGVVRREVDRLDHRADALAARQQAAAPHGPSLPIPHMALGGSFLQGRVIPCLGWGRGTPEDTYYTVYLHPFPSVSCPTFSPPRTSLPLRHSF